MISKKVDLSSFRHYKRFSILFKKTLSQPLQKAPHSPNQMTDEQTVTRQQDKKSVTLTEMAVV